MLKTSVENIVATSTIAKDLDLEKIYSCLDNAQYNPTQFPGVVYRIKSPKTATLLFSSGKLVCTGAKSLKDLKKAISMVVKTLDDAHISVNKNPKIDVQNIVASSDLHATLNLNRISICLGLDRVEYEPEQFPGLVYRIDEPKVVALLFGSGKIVLTGAKRLEDIDVGVKKINTELSNAGLITKS